MSRNVSIRGVGATAMGLAALLVLACATEPTVVVWEKPGASQQEVDEAIRVCTEEMSSAQAKGVNRTRFEAESSGTCFVDCMKTRGFSWRTETVPSCEVPEDGS